MRLGTFQYILEHRSGDDAIDLKTLSDRLETFSAYPDDKAVMLVADLGYGDETVNLENIFAASRAYMINIRIFMPGTAPCLIRYKPPFLPIEVQTLNLSVEYKLGDFNWRLILPK